TSTSDPRFLKVNINFDPPLYGKSKSTVLVLTVVANLDSIPRISSLDVSYCQFCKSATSSPSAWFGDAVAEGASDSLLSADFSAHVPMPYKTKSNNPTHARKDVFFFCFAPHCGQLSALSLTGPPHSLHGLIAIIFPELFIVQEKILIID